MSESSAAIISYAERELLEAIRLLDEGNVPTARAAMCEVGRTLEEALLVLASGGSVLDVAHRRVAGAA